MLGLFLPIQAGGWSASTLPRTTDWTFDYNADRCAREALGFDLVFALSQWLPKGGYGGVFDGQALDSFMTLALTARTERIILVATSHVLYGPGIRCISRNSPRRSITSRADAGASTS